MKIHGFFAIETQISNVFYLLKKSLNWHDLNPDPGLFFQSMKMKWIRSTVFGEAEIDNRY